MKNAPLPAPVRRAPPVLHADPRRVITRLFLPGQEMLSRGVSRADAVLQRVLAMSEPEVADTLSGTLARFADRHHDLPATFAAHFDRMAHRLPADLALSPARRELIGAFFTQEYSVEAAALFNPSMTPHPDQSGLADGQLRFVMSVRAVGEGHVSSIEFRTGVVDATGRIEVDDPGRHLVTGTASPAAMSRDTLRDALADQPTPADVEHVLGLLPASFGAEDLEAALASVRSDRLTRGSSDDLVTRIRWLVSCNYRLSFPDVPLAERVVHPIGPDESHGVEDVRLTRFVAADGDVSYLGTYTAYDGSRVAQHLFATKDFHSFEMSRLAGAAAGDKGLALFPRPVGGAYLAISRWDRETIGVAASADARSWLSAVTVQAPAQPWQAVQLGNCGPPIETPAGWLVLTHGVGPMRCYGIGAILLDLEDPTRLIGALDEPLLTPADDERDGYVPNVVYSCGALLHRDLLVIPYGCSDSAIRFAVLELPELLARLG